MYRRIYVFFVLMILVAWANLSAQGIQSRDKVELSKEQQFKFDYYFYEAMNAKSTNRYSAAYDYLQHCFYLDSTNANVLYELGTYYNLFDKKNTAMDYYRKATDYDKDNFYYRIAYANLCLEFKQYSDAIEQYELLVKSNPDKSELFVYLSESYRLDGNLENAIKALDRLEQNIGMNEKISIQKFQLYSALNQQEKGFLEMQKYVTKYPNEIKYKVLLGNLYLQSDKPKEAIKVYEDARKTDPEDPYLISSIAEYHEYIGDEKAAESELYTALTSPKMDVNTKLEILTQYITSLNQKEGDLIKANVLFDTLIVQHPQEPQLNFMYGSLLMLEKDKDGAFEQFKVFALANPTNSLGWEQMLSTAFPDSINRAVYICTEAIKHLPQYPLFHFYLAVAKSVNKEYDESLSILQSTVNLVDASDNRLLSDYYGQMGDVYYQTGRADSAYLSYDKALRYNSKNMGILNNYSYYLALEEKNLDKAEKMSSVTIQSEPTNSTYLDTYGWVLFKQGAYTMAKIYIEKAINYTEESKEKLSGEVLEHYGDVLFKTGEKEKALEYWIKAKETGDDTKSNVLNEKVERKTYVEDKKNK